MRIITIRPWSAWLPGSQRGLLLGAALLGVGVLATWGYRQHQGLASAQRNLQTLESQVEQAERQGSPAQSGAAQDGGVATGEARLDPLTWPVQHEGMDAWVRAAAQAAAHAAGIQLLQLSITYPESVPDAAPFAVLQIGARGEYSALKSWQAQMQWAMPSLAVERLRWQGAASDGSGMLAAEWTWRLWLRPAGGEWAATGGKRDAGEDQGPAALRTALADARKDPFRGFVPPPPPPPVYVAPPPEAVQVPPPPPPLYWETFGHMQGLDGQHRVMGHWGDPASVETLEIGSASPRGHRVTQITPQLLELVHPQTQERLQFSLPQAPRFERR